MPLQNLYDHPELYDLIIRPGPCEAFYRELARRTGGPVLELACGTGRLTTPLATDGHDIFGLDASSKMLRIARAKAAAENAKVTFIEGDMRDFDISQLFSLIIMSCNSLGHLTTNEELRRCLCRIERHLAPGGLFAFDIVNPSVRALSRSDSERNHLNLGPNPSSAISIEEIATYDPVQQLRVLQWEVTEPGLLACEMAPLVLRQIFPQEVPLLLQSVGLELAGRFGDFAGNPLTGDSLNQVCIAHAHSTAPTREDPQSEPHSQGRR